MNIKLTGLVLGTAFAAVAFTACDTAPANTNMNANRVMNNANSNVAVVVNSNSNAVVSNTNANSRYGSNITRADYDRDRASYERDVKDTSSNVGSGANDMWLWTKTRAALLTTNDLRESTVNVDVVNDVVTLRGTVATAAQKTKAEQVAKGIDGVKSVKNELKVAAADSMTNTNANSMVNGNANRR